MNLTTNAESYKIGPAIRAIRQLSPGSEGVVAALVS
jgi:hypothetical protein